MQAFIAEVYEFCRKNDLIQKGDKIIAGISGGMDSVCLLYVLMALREELGFSLFAVHVEHGIRGEASCRDESFVSELCGREGIPFRSYRVNAPALMREKGLSLEEAARILRYDAFSQALSDFSADKLAVAHHRDDQTETVLFHLIRGSGLTGLSGIRPKHGRIIRPLLFLSRAEIEGYVGKNGLPYVTDQSNYDDAFTRNRIRHELLPLLESLHKGAALHIAKTAQIMQEADAFIREEAEDSAGRMAKRKGPDLYEIRLDGFSEKKPILQRYMIKGILSELTEKGRDITAAHIEDIRLLSQRQSGRRICLPYGLTAVREHETLLIGRLPVNADAKRQIPGAGEIYVHGQGILLNPQGVTVLPNGLCAACGIEPYSEDWRQRLCGDPEENGYTKCFDYDRINSDLFVRTRRPGDRIAIDRAGHTQTIKKLFINKKLPAREKELLPLIVCGDEILWAVGLRTSTRYWISESTRRILRIRIFQGEKNE